MHDKKVSPRPSADTSGCNTCVQYVADIRQLPRDGVNDNEGWRPRWKVKCYEVCFNVSQIYYYALFRIPTLNMKIVHDKILQSRD